ncbi:MAG: hypothetical protein DRQ59_13265 [Gammaproteobacteria bacterium]|nr:MAG: hypothetical protein DRQ59_13265 [Gammaproteobacteria bacterium]
MFLKNLKPCILLLGVIATSSSALAITSVIYIFAETGLLSLAALVLARAELLVALTPSSKMHGFKFLRNIVYLID